MSDLSRETDAMVWAEVFCYTLKKCNWSLADIDESLMVAWFACAIMAMHDVKADEIERLEARVRELERYKAAIDDILDDPIISEPLQMKRGLREIFAIARAAAEPEELK